ncbi:MAG TPA: enoyl-CoA hydratase-related protein [Aggregatilineales bacterium]|nr:enoyl-CoA hydratase-related protein [Aggregatilineales bacterium]
MDYKNILVEKLENRVGLIRLNRPDAMNALNEELGQEVIDALTAHESDPDIGCHVITGSDRVFAAGADIKGMVDASPVTMLNSEKLTMWAFVASLKKPIIAAISGVALGGGCELAMACDIIIASESAKFGQPEINLGIIPGGGGTQRLTHLVGKHIAMEMVLNNRWLRADEAMHYGLVNRVYPVESYLDEAIKLAAEVAARAPVAIRVAKESVNAAYELSLQEGIKAERRAFSLLFSTQDQREGVDAFINKRPANWKGV